MLEPVASRPHMPGYGVLAPEEGSGLLDWVEARERLAASHDAWLSTVTPSGAPHVMPVWVVWDDDALWFSCSAGSRKARNLAAEPRCVLTSDDPRNPVVVEGVATVVTATPLLARFLGVVNDKYGTSYGLDLVDPDVNRTVRVRPTRAFALNENDFGGSPTRWVFPG